MASDNDQPVFIDRGQGPGFTDIDGFSYIDFNASDLAVFCGHANPAIVSAVQAQAARSTQFLLPTEASVQVAEELARRFLVPQWQFTLSATQANTEAIRLARAVTGREVILLFQGHYHGHFEEGLARLARGRARRKCPCHVLDDVAEILAGQLHRPPADDTAQSCQDVALTAPQRHVPKLVTSARRLLNFAPRRSSPSSG